MDIEIVKERLRKVTKPVIYIFVDEPAVLRITGPTTIVGDIHGDLTALDLILEQWQKSGTTNILFLGDYVDRGEQSAECLLTVLELKTIDPTHVFLLRGNHEDEQMNRYYGFYDEIGQDNAFLMCMHRIFEVMPIAAMIDDKIFCVHGGITADTNINHITKADSLQYLWNDPSNKLGIHKSQRGPNIQNFGPDIVDKFLAVNKLEGIVRAHEFQECGYRCWFDGKLLSLFSSLDYCGRKNKGAYAEFIDGNIELYILSLEKSKYYGEKNIRCDTRL